MTLAISKVAARRIVLSALTGLALAGALPQAASAMATSNEGIWRVDPANSTYRTGFATLAIERAGQANAPGGRLIVVSKGNVYVVSDTTAYSGKGIQKVDYSDMTRQGKAALIGTNARAVGPCGFRCQSGLPETRLTLGFRPVNGAGQQINEMIAARK
jgi:hypothetical protein